MMRRLAAAVAAMLAGFPLSDASSSEVRLRLGRAELAPIDHTVFCQRYARDCVRTGGRQPIPYSAARQAELQDVNTRVNASIAPTGQPGNLLLEQWTVAPAIGDCDDYAVTKRHELLKRGWPSASLLLAEVVLRSGEHHLVLVARTQDGDLVLDSRRPRIREVAATLDEYVWQRIQSPENPKFWKLAVVEPVSIRTADRTGIPATRLAKELGAGPVIPSGARSTSR